MGKLCLNIRGNFGVIGLSNNRFRLTSEIFRDAEQSGALDPFIYSVVKYIIIEQKTPH